MVAGRGLVVAVDGGAATGKSALCKALASRFGLPYFNAGLIYRALALACLRRNRNLDDATSCQQVWTEVSIDLVFVAGCTRVTIDGGDSTTKLRDRKVDEAVPRVSQHGGVRDAITTYQRAVVASEAARTGIIIDGRDATSVVVPDADVKLLLLASESTVANRSALRSTESDPDSDVARNRADALVAAFQAARDDVTTIDTDVMDMAAVFELAVAEILAAQRRLTTE